MKLLRDRFESKDGIVHIEKESNGTFVVVTEAICGRWFSPLMVGYVSDDMKVTCMNCLAAEVPHDVRP